MFHRAHASEWCARLKKDPDLAELKRRAQGSAIDSPAAQLCAEMAQRHIRLVRGPAQLPSALPATLPVASPACAPVTSSAGSTASPTVISEPLCAIASPGAATIDFDVSPSQSSLTALDAAKQWCTLPDCEQRRVQIIGFDVQPRALPVGQSIEVTWEVEHSRIAGDTYLFGLFVAPNQALQGLSGLLQDPGVPTFFRISDTIGDPRSATCTRMDAGTATCTFGGTDITGQPFAAPIDGLAAPEGLSGSQIVTFRACAAAVFAASPDDETCDAREVTIDF